MKKIVYQVMGHTGVYDPATETVAQKEILVKEEREYSEENEAIVKAMAYQGEYTIEEVADA